MNERTKATLMGSLGAILLGGVAIALMMKPDSFTEDFKREASSLCQEAFAISDEAFAEYGTPKMMRLGGTATRVSSSSTSLRWKDGENSLICVVQTMTDGGLSVAQTSFNTTN